MNIALCSIGRLENRYAIEFVEYYKQLGFNHIYIADNNRENEEHFEEVLSPYIDNNFVTIYDYRNVGEYANYKFYLNIYNKISNYYDWIAFFDFDEFLFLENDKTIQEYLSRDCFKNYNQILINWKIYTDNDLVYDDGRGCLERFTIPLNNNVWAQFEWLKENENIKSIIRTKLQNVENNTNHLFINDILKDTTCNNKGNKINDLTWRQPINHEYAYLKHFLTKTIDEWVNNKYVKGSVDRNYDLFLKTYPLERFFKYNNLTIEKLNYLKEHNINIDNLTQENINNWKIS